MAMLAEPRRRQKWSLNPRGSAWSNDDSKFGQKLIEKMGWSKGQGLGREGQGMTEHVRVSFKDNFKGIGYKGKDDEWIKHYEGFENVLATLNSHENSAANSINNSACNSAANSDEDDGQKTGDKKSLESSSKASRARVHYHKFTRSKDLSRYSKDDLGCVLGSKRAKQLAKEEVEAVETNVEAEVGEVEHLNGVTTIKGCNLQEYFAQKMEALKKHNNTEPQTAKQENHQDSDSDEGVARLGFGFSLDGGEAAAEPPPPECAEDGEGKKKKKKKKKKKHCEELEEVNAIVECLGSKAVSEERHDETEIGEARKKKKKKKQESSEEKGGKENSSDGNHAAECVPPEHTVKKKKKRGKTTDAITEDPVSSLPVVEEDQEKNNNFDGNQTTECLAEPTTGMKKSKKKRKITSASIEEFVTDIPVGEDSQENSKKKRKKDEMLAESSECQKAAGQPEKEDKESAERKSSKKKKRVKEHSVEEDQGAGEHDHQIQLQMKASQPSEEDSCDEGATGTTTFSKKLKTEREKGSGKERDRQKVDLEMNNPTFLGNWVHKLSNEDVVDKEYHEIKKKGKKRRKRGQGGEGDEMQNEDAALNKGTKRNKKQLVIKEDSNIQNYVEEKTGLVKQLDVNGDLKDMDDTFTHRLGKKETFKLEAVRVTTGTLSEGNDEVNDVNGGKEREECIMENVPQVGDVEDQVLSSLEKSKKKKKRKHKITVNIEEEGSENSHEVSDNISRGNKQCKSEHCSKRQPENAKSSHGDESWLAKDVITFSESKSFPEAPESLETRRERGTTRDVKHMLSKITTRSKLLKQRVLEVTGSSGQPSNGHSEALPEDITSRQVKEVPRRSLQKDYSAADQRRNNSRWSSVRRRGPQGGLNKETLKLGVQAFKGASLWHCSGYPT